MYDFEFIVIEKFVDYTVNNMDKVLLMRGFLVLAAMHPST